MILSLEQYARIVKEAHSLGPAVKSASPLMNTWYEEYLQDPNAYIDNLYNLLRESDIKEAQMIEQEILTMKLNAIQQAISI